MNIEINFKLALVFMVIGCKKYDGERHNIQLHKHHRLDPVEQDRLVRHRHQLLGTGVRDRPEPRTGTAGQDEPLHDPGA